MWQNFQALFECPPGSIRVHLHILKRGNHMRRCYLAPIFECLLIVCASCHRLRGWFGAFGNRVEWAEAQISRDRTSRLKRLKQTFKAPFTASRSFGGEATILGRLLICLKRGFRRLVNCAAAFADVAHVRFFIGVYFIVDLLGDLVSLGGCIWAGSIFCCIWHTPT